MSKYLDEQEKLKNMTDKEKREYINQKANKQKKKKKILRIMAICLCFVFLIGLVTVSKYSITQLKYKNIASLDEYKISKQDYQFYYNLSTNEWISNNYSYLDYYGLDLNSDFSTQVYDEENNLMWSDFFVSRAETFIKQIYLINKEANEKDFSDYEDVYNQMLETVKEDASKNNLTYEKYVASVYGTSLSIKDFENYIKNYSICISYSNKVKDDIKNNITDDKIMDYYNDDKNNYDTVRYKLIKLSVKDIEDFDENETKELEKKATNISSKIKTEEDFNREAEEYYKDDEDFSVEECIFTEIGEEHTNTSYAEWLYDSTRKYGDLVVTSSEDNSSYYIVFYLDRKLDNENTVNFRYIYLSYDNDDENEVPNLEECQKNMDNIVNEYIESGSKEDKFVELANNNGMSSGGLFNNAIRSSISNKDISDWLWDESRKYKDNKTFKDDNALYFVCFIKQDERYYKITIKDKIAETEYNDWIDSLIKDKNIVFN